MKKNEEKLNQILQFDSKMSSVVDIDIVLEKTLIEAINIVNADAGSIYIKEGDVLKINYSKNKTLEKDLPPGGSLIFKYFSIPINKNTISGYVAFTGKALNISDVYKIPPNRPYSFSPSYDNASGYRTVSSFTVPIISNGNVISVFQVINKIDKNGNIIKFSAEDELLMSHFSANVSVIIERSRLLRDTMLRMAEVARMRDPKETGDHVNRVAGISMIIYEKWARKKNIPQKDIERIKDIFKVASMLHDVGKVAIPDHILKKEGKLTEEEYKIMKTHTITGYKLFLGKSSEYDKIAGEIILHHHENWDGTGYPGEVDEKTGEPVPGAKPLKGEKIPLYSRIVAVADVYDALSNKRTYKESWPEERVLQELRSMSGTKFDPEIVDIFFEILPAVRNINSRYSEA